MNALTREVDAVVGFVDLAGFTSASERFGELGNRGTEQLREIINRLFTPAIESIHRAGGEVGWFAGDAIGVVFDRSVTDDLSAVLALIDAATAIADLQPIETDIGELTLAVKVGIAAGPIRWNTIGESPLLSWFGGDAIDLSSDAEHHAQSGHVVLHDSIARGLPPDLVTSPIDKWFSLVESAPPQSRQPTTQRPFEARRDPAYLPPRVALLATEGNEDLLDEHRPLTAMFVQMPNPQHDIDELIAIRALIEDLGGLLQAAIEGDKGAIILALFGAPTALPDREARAATAAHEITSRVDGCSIGIASGRVFAGRVGSSARWDYSVMGDRVNTAARLMQAAGRNEILLDSATAAAADTLRVGARRELELKGKREHETVVPLLGLGSDNDRSGARAGAFVGRAKELTALVSRFSEPGLTVVAAEAGAGKSRLVGHAVSTLDGEEPITVALQRSDRSRPFRLWQQLLPALAGTSAAEYAERVRIDLRGDARAPLIGPVLGLDFESTSLTSSVSESDRPELLASLVVEILARTTTASRVVIEDLHWADDSSLELLHRVAGRLERVNLSTVATTRLDTRLRLLSDVHRVEMIELGPLDDTATTTLVDNLWQRHLDRRPSPTLAEELVARSGGSPLFCEQLVAFARHHGIAPHATALPIDVGIPTTLVDLLLARLDDLPANASTVATYAAVFGESFSLSDLIAVFGAWSNAELIASGLNTLLEEAVIEGVDDYRFVHSLFPESTHERLSFSVRSDLHLAAIEHLERSHADDLSTPAADLARHAESTADVERQRRYFRVAADQAAARYANDVSTYWYRKLVPITNGADLGTIHLALGQVEMVAGGLDLAETHLTEAIELLSGDRAAAAAAEMSLARVLVDMGDPKPAFEVLDRLIADLRRLTQWETLHEVLEVKADLSTMLGDLGLAEQVEAIHTELRDELGDEHPGAQPLQRLIPLLWLRGDLDAAVLQYERLYDTCCRNGDILTAAAASADLAGIHYERADVHNVFLWLEKAREAFEEAGDRRSLVGVVQTNDAYLRRQLGDHAGSLRLAVAALEIAVTDGDHKTVGALLTTLSRVDGVDPIDVSRRAMVIGDAVGNQEAFAYGLHELSLGLLDQGDAALAVRILEYVVDAKDIDRDRARLDLARARLVCGPADDNGIEILEELASSSPSPDCRALAAASLAEAGHSEFTTADARLMCADAFDQFPSEDLATALREMPGEPPRLVKLAPAPPPTKDFRTVLALADQLPILRGWELRSHELLAEIVEDAHVPW